MTAPASATRRNLDVARLGAQLAAMWRIRAFEEAAIRGLKDGLVLGAIHPSIGQEAVAAAVCLNLDRADLMLSTHRGHGHTLAKGADAGAMMRELFGRDGGTCGGKGGSMHIADFSVGMLGANGVVGANIPIAVGAAHAITLRGGGEIVACFFGDGAINRGPFLEGLNWAKIFRLPVLFVCEDNAWSATTRTSDLTAGQGAAARAESLGIPAEILDGNDAIALDEAARAAIAALRAGAGPRLLHVTTYRLTGHTAADAAGYRDPAEVAAWWERDPIARLAAALREAGVPEERLEALRTDAYAEMEAIYDDARAAPWSSVAGAYEDVQDIGHPAERAF